MKYKSFIILLLLFIVPFFALAQDTTAVEKYDYNSIYIQNGFFGNRYVKKGIYYPIGFMGNKIKQELEISPNAVIEFKKYRNNQLFASILSSVSMGLLYASIFSSGSSADINSPVYFISLGGAISSGIIMTKSRNHLQKSVWLYNKDILK